MRALIPFPLSSDPAVSAVVSAIEPELEALRDAAPLPNVLGRLADVPRSVLNETARYLGVDLYDSGASDTVVRALIRGAFGWHRRRGTAWSLRWVLSALGFTTVEVVTPAESRAFARTRGVRYVDGSEQVAAGGLMVGYVAATGLPRLVNWAEFYLTLDLDTEAHVSDGGAWGAQLERAVRLGAPASRRAVYVLRFASTTEFEAQGALYEVRRALGPRYECSLLYPGLEGQLTDGTRTLVANAVVARRVDSARAATGRYQTPRPAPEPPPGRLVQVETGAQTATLAAEGEGAVWKVDRYDIEVLGQTYRRATAGLSPYSLQAEALVRRTPTTATLTVSNQN